MFIAFLWAAAAPVPVATAIDPASWFSPNNYPAEAAKKGIQGSVTFDADVDANGRATACRITVSSGSQLLDQATCNLVLSQGRFIPAKGADGKPVPGHYGNRAIWVLQGPARPQTSTAQDTTTGSRLPVNSEDLAFTRSVPDELFDAPLTQSDRDSFAVAEKFGACLVRADPATSMDFVMAEPGSAGSDAAKTKLQAHMPDCLGASMDQFLVGEIRMTIKPPLVRGVIAEALYKLQFAERPQPSGHVSAAPIIPAAAVDQSDQQEAIVYDFAQCVTEKEPSAVRSLILSKVGSHEEQAAVAELTPSLSPCLYRGQTLHADRLTFRARLAEALYRWSVAATPR